MEDRCDFNPHPWYAVRVRSRSEKSVAAIARYNGFEEFLPLYRSRRHWSDRVKSLDLPLFPCYVFCRVDPACRLQLLTIPGVQHIVGAGKTPLPVNGAEIAALQVAAQSGLPAEPWPFLRAGQRVLLERGPLAGLEGLLIEIRKNFRLLLSVNLLNRAVAVEIDHDWVTPVREPARGMAPTAFSSPRAFRTPQL
jgi:transcription antitermination factor NusG